MRRAGGYVVGAAATLVLLKRVLGGGILPRGLRLGAEARRVAGYAGILLVVDAAYTAFSQIDVLIIGGGMFRFVALLFLFSTMFAATTSPTSNTSENAAAVPDLPAPLGGAQARASAGAVRQAHASGRARASAFRGRVNSIK